MPRPSTRAGALSNVNSSGYNPRYSGSPSSRTITSQQLDQKLSALTEQITKAVVAQVKDIITAEVSKSMDEIKFYIDEQLELMQDNINIAKQTLETMHNEILLLKRKFAKQENAAVASELRLHGVPETDNENLTGLLEKLCQSLKIPLPEICEVKRLKGNSNRSTNAQNLQNTEGTESPSTDATNNTSSNTHSPQLITPIIIKLSSPQSKHSFLHNLAKFRRDNNEILRLKHMGFESEKEIYINEQLTKANHKILKTAVGMKKKKSLWSVYTRNGIIFVKKRQNENAIRIENVNQLRDFNVSERVSDANETGFRGFQEEH